MSTFFCMLRMLPFILLQPQIIRLLWSFRLFSHHLHIFLNNLKLLISQKKINDYLKSSFSKFSAQNTFRHQTEKK